MIIEYYTSESVIYKKEPDPRNFVVIPRKNEIVYLNDKEYTVKSISHSPVCVARSMGQNYETHKVSVELM